MNSPLLCSSLRLLCIIGGSCCPALGANFYWDTTNASGLLAGDGQWNTSNSQNEGKRWSDINGSANPVHWANNSTPADHAFFTASGTSNIEVVANVTVNTMTFTGTGYTISASSTYGITLTGSTIQTDAAATISAPFVGTGGLTKTGSATLTLSGTNTYSGTTTVSAGTLSISGSINSSNTVQVNGGILSTTGGDKLSNSAAVTVAGGTLTVGGADTIASLAMSSGTIGGSNTLTAATYALSGGTVNGNLGTGALTSSGSVSLNGSSAAGTVAVTAGTLTLGSSNRLSDSASLTVSGGTLALGTNSDTVGAVQLTSGSITGSGTLTGTVYNVQSGSASAALGGSGVALNKTTGGTVTLSGANSYTGTTTVSAGTLVINGNQAGATGAVNVSSGATLSGTGTVGGNTTISGTHAVGTAGTVGLQQFVGNVSYQAGSIFSWDLNASSTASGFDVVDRTTSGGSVSVDVGAIFRIVIGNGVSFANNFWQDDRTWAWSSIFTDFSAIGAFSNSNLQIVGGPSSSLGSFSVNAQGVQWNAIPETSTALAGFLVAAGLFRRSRRLSV